MKNISNYTEGMERINNFSAMVEFLRCRGSKKRVAVAWASDESTRKAVMKALESGFISAIFVGCKEIVESDENLMKFADNISFVEASDGDDAAAKAVALVKNGKADILMKGMINTDNLLRAILNKENGILEKGAVMTHISATEIPGHYKILFFSDAAAIPYPTPEQREAQIHYLADLIHRIGIKQPRIALIHCTEKVNEKHFPFTADYKVKVEEARQGKFGDTIVDGPLDAKCACSLHALEAKGIKSPLDGESDALIFPDIIAANTFYKTLTLFANAEIAGMLKGAMAPVVLPSRGDTSDSKYFSLAMASL